MTEPSNNEWETLSDDSSSNTTLSAQSGFSSWGSESAVSLLEAYQSFFADMTMMLNLPSAANATTSSLSSLPQRLIQDFEPAFTRSEKFAQFMPVYLKARSDRVKIWSGFCNEPVAPMLFSYPDKKVK